MRTVLVVDGDHAWRRVLAGWLEAEGMRVIRLSRGEWVTRAIETHRADGVVLAVHLPGIDGFRLLENIRARWPSLPVIMMTSFGGAEFAGRQAGATAYLDKPFHVSELLHELQRLTDAGGALGTIV
jgi:two-component system OmpR family response regulator